MSASPVGVVQQTDLPGLIRRGKVRDLYDLGEQLMIVATDRISAFDVVMADPVPGKGVLLTRISDFWLQTLPACRPHHCLYLVDDGRCPPGYERFLDQLRGRAMVVRRVDILPVECIVRGYLSGSGWKEYQATAGICGVALPPGLRRSQRLDVPIFTPSTKADVGHDQPLTFDECVAVVQGYLSKRGRGVWQARDLMTYIRERALRIYEQAAAHAERCGLILADTKFEFGLYGAEVLLADEVLTPDSSRFWPRDGWQVGEDPPSFDKQYVRNYLESTGWNKTPPPPRLPAEVIARTRERYEEAFSRLTGQSPPAAAGAAAAQS